MDIAAVPLERPWLLADWDRVWIVAADGLGQTCGREVRLQRGTDPLGDIAAPFLFQGRPAVIEHGPAGLTLLGLENGRWVPQTNMTVAGAERICCPERNVQAVAAGDTLHLFLRFGDTLYHHEGFPETLGERREDWQVVAPARSHWHAVLVGGLPAVFVQQDAGFKGRIRAWRLEADGWRPFFDYHGRMIADMGVLATDRQEVFYLLTQPFPGALRLVRVADDVAGQELRFGQPNPFPTGLLGAAVLPHLFTALTPLLLAVILSRLMPRHRVCQHSDGRRLVPYASLARRGAAQAVDALLIMGPVLAAFYPLFADFETVFAGPGGPLAIFRHMGWAMLWLLCALLLISCLEGRWGITPGKWLARIRVLGTELAPCGFGRALVRNLLKVADGFFNYLVGILFAALSENWQRVGDMAARTVVVDVRGDGSARRDGSRPAK